MSRQSADSEPSLDDLRSNRFLVRTSGTHLTHTSRWEDTKSLKQHTLRPTIKFLNFLNKKTGPKGRRSNRHIGATPDDSLVRAGAPTRSAPHQLRSHMANFFAMSDEEIQTLLERNSDYKPGKKGQVGIVMPNLARAVEELYRRMIERNPELRHHVAFKRQWAPAICRLIELHASVRFAKPFDLN